MKSEQAIGYDGQPYTIGDRVKRRDRTGPLGEVVGINLARDTVLVRPDDTRSDMLVHGKPSDFSRVQP